MQAVWNGAVLAESDQTVVVEGNHYFPLESVHTEFLSPSSTHTTCSWKGVASYYTVEVDGKRNADAAWYYPQPSDAAQSIRGYVAFWHGVKVIDGLKTRSTADSGAAARPADTDGRGWFARMCDRMLSR